MAHRDFKLSEEEQKAFHQRESQTRDSRELKRLIGVRLYGEGRRTQEIQEIVGCSWRTLMDWCSRYRAEGLAGLTSHWGSPNAAKLTLTQRQDLKRRLHEYRPDQILPPGVRLEHGQFWTVSDLKVAVWEWYEVTYQSDTSYRCLLQESGFSLQQTENQYRSRPSEADVAEFVAQLEKKSATSSDRMGRD